MLSPQRHFRDFRPIFIPIFIYKLLNKSLLIFDLFLFYKMRLFYPSHPFLSYRIGSHKKSLVVTVVNACKFAPIFHLPPEVKSLRSQHITRKFAPIFIPIFIPKPLNKSLANLRLFLGFLKAEISVKIFIFVDFFSKLRFFKLFC